MTESDTDDLRAHIDREVAASLIWQDDVLSQEQARNLSYYFGNPLGDEAEGRSQCRRRGVFVVGDARGGEEHLLPGEKQHREGQHQPAAAIALRRARRARYAR